MQFKIYSTIEVEINKNDCIKSNVIYCLTFPNGKKYIGQTITNLSTRISSHCSESFSNEKKHLKKSYAIRKYMTFRVEVLYQGDDLDNKEIEFIALYDTFKNGYNLTAGGGGGGLGNKGDKSYWYGKTLSDAHIEKLSKSHLGKKVPAKYKCVYQLSLTGDFIKEWDSIQEAEKTLNINQSRISAVCRGRRKTTAGFIWKYKT